jgi:hypothetical protein
VVFWARISEKTVFGQNDDQRFVRLPPTAAQVMPAGIQLGSPVYWIPMALQEALPEACSFVLVNVDVYKK